MAAMLDSQASLLPVKAHKNPSSAFSVHSSVLKGAHRHRKPSCGMLLIPRGESATYVSSLPGWLLSADGYTLNDGSCACHKQWGWFTNACEGSFCFDYIGEPQQGVAQLCGTASPCLTETSMRQSAYRRDWRPAVPLAHFQCSPRDGQGSMAATVAQKNACSCMSSSQQNKQGSGGIWQIPDTVVKADPCCCNPCHDWQSRCLLLQGPLSRQTGKALQQQSIRPARPTQTSAAPATLCSARMAPRGALPVPSSQIRAAGPRTGPSLL